VSCCGPGCGCWSCWVEVLIPLSRVVHFNVGFNHGGRVRSTKPRPAATPQCTLNEGVDRFNQDS
jgi:hypothetical protein